MTSANGPASAIDPRQFRAALGAWATGVGIVTTDDGTGAFAGMTINSFASVSLDPPMVLWSLQYGASTAPAFLHSARFAISVLGVQHRELAMRFTRQDVDRFEGQPFSAGVCGLPVVDGALAVFECRVAARYPGGDHEILLGQVDHFRIEEGAALGFHRGQFLPLG